MHHDLCRLPRSIEPPDQLGQKLPRIKLVKHNYMVPAVLEIQPVRRRLRMHQHQLVLAPVPRGFQLALPIHNHGFRKFLPDAPQALLEPVRNHHRLVERLIHQRAQFGDFLVVNAVRLALLVVNKPARKLEELATEHRRVNRVDLGTAQLQHQFVLKLPVQGDQIIR
jgi:hypothetical protein